MKQALLATLSRRQALASAGAALAAAAGVRAASAAEKGTAYGLIGDRYHNSDYIRVGLNRTIQEDLDVRMDLCDEPRNLTAETLRGYKMLIILRDGMAWPEGYPDESTNPGWVGGGKVPLVSDPPVPPATGKSQFWMTPEQGKAVRQFVTNGGSALFLHNATHIGVTNADFRDVLGAGYVGHPPIRTFKVNVTNPDHPITKGVRNFVVTDEQHYMDYDKDPKYVFLETVNVDGLDYRGRGPKSLGGWAYDYGRGRVCYLSPGHMLTDLWNPEYVKLQHNAVRWLLRQQA